MSKKGENIYKRKDGRWEGRYIRYYDSSQKPKFGYVYGKTYTDVKHRLNELKGNAPTPVDLYLHTISCKYDVILDEWLALSRIRVKESTYACYSRLINTHIRAALGSYNINELSTQMIEQFISNKLSFGNLTNGEGLSSKTVNDILVIIKSSLDYAKYHNFDVRCNLNRVSIKRPNKDIRVFSHDEQGMLVNTLLTDMDLYKFGVLLSLYTGIRIGELCSLQWQDFSPCGCILSVRKTIQRVQNTDNMGETKTKVIVTEPKSQCSKRDIPLPAFLTEYVIRFRSGSSVYVLSGLKDKYVEPRTMQNHFKNYIKQSGIADAGFHTLRHTFATRCVEVGFEIKSLSEILGHSNVNITLNRYVHSSFELKATNMSKLSLGV